MINNYAFNVREIGEYDASENYNQSRFFSKFLADSAATEHLNHSKIICITSDLSDKTIIKCAHKHESADLKTEGAVNIELRLENRKGLKIEK